MSARTSRLRPWQRFHVRLTLFHGVIMLLVLAAMGVTLYELGFSAELRGLQGRLRSTVTVLSHHIDADAVAAMDPLGPQGSPGYDALYETFSHIAAADPEIDTVYVLRTTETPGTLRFVLDHAVDGKSGEPGATYDATRFPKMIAGLKTVAIESALWRDEFATSLSGYAPLVTSDGSTVGLVGVDVEAPHIDSLRGRVLTVTLLIFGAAALLLGLVAWLVAWRIRRPLAVLNEAAERIAEGDFSGGATVERDDEFGLMARHFDAIAESLREREFLRDVFGRFVSRDVARSVLARKEQAVGGEERIATVLFSDLVGYSSMTEKVPPREMVRVLNAYLSAMCEVADAHQGCIIEFLGDSILTVFNTPNEVPQHAATAVRCALAMRERLELLNDELATSDLSDAWREGGFQRLRARYGIHTGPLIAGTMGSPTRVKYGLIGDTVNIAARLEEMNRTLDTEILISDATLAHLDDDLRDSALSMGGQALRGREQEVHVYAM